jgi:hypothetical protein
MSGARGMNDVPKVDLPQIPEFAWPQISGWDMAKIGSETAGRLREHGQVIAQAMAEWNAECRQIAADSMRRTEEAIAEVAKCQNPSDVLIVQAKWLQANVDCFVRQTNRIVEMNSKFLHGLIGQFGQR